MDLWETSSKLDEESGRWNSVNDALQAISSLSRVTKVSDSNFLTCDQYRSSGTVGSNHPIYQGTSDYSVKATIDEASNFGLGRGKLLKELEKKFSTRQQLDEQIFSDLRMAMGPGFSNELIEDSFGSAYPPSNGFDSQGTGDVSDCSIEEKKTAVDFVIGESDIMKKVCEAEKSFKCNVMRTKPLRCRNALILNLLKNKKVEEDEQGERKEPVLLKGPDVFLPNKSYKTSTLASHSSEHTDVPLFTEKDFPAL